MEHVKTKNICRAWAASLLVISGLAQSSPAPYQLSDLESYLIRSFAWEQYESFVNTGSSTLFENPKVYYFNAGALAKLVSSDPSGFLRKYKGQRIFVHGVPTRHSPSFSTFVFDAPNKQFTINIRMGSHDSSELQKPLKKNFYCQVISGDRNEIFLGDCISGLSYQKNKINEIEQGIKDYLSGKDQNNPNMPTYAMLAYMALVSAKLLPDQSACKTAISDEGPDTSADIRACNQEVTTLWQNSSESKHFEEAMDSVERDLTRHGADLNMIRQAASLMD